MYASNPKSRIAREFFYILNALRNHYRTLLRLDENETVRYTMIMVLLAVYMLREEGIKKFKSSLIVEQTKGVLPKSSVYKAVQRLFEEGILEEEYGDYVCLARTPEFLLNPEELYGQQLTKVKEKDYELEDKIRDIMAEMMQHSPPSKDYHIDRAPPSVKDTGRFTEPVYKQPSISTKDLKKSLDKKKKEKKEDKELDKEISEVEQELGDMFL